MRLYVCTDHAAHYPVGVASIVIAHNEAEARRLLDAELVKCGLKGSDEESYTLTEIGVNHAQAIVLRDGNY